MEATAMQDLARRRATYADLVAAPPNLVAEIIDGELITHPRPASRQAYAASVLGGFLNQRFQSGNGGPGGWWIVDEPELHLADDVAVPDIGGWRRDRMPKYIDAAYFSLAPDWLCEFLSPSTAGFDRGQKASIYARHGVRHLWLVDQIARKLEAYKLRDGDWALQKTWRDDEDVAAAPFTGVPIRLGMLWPE